MGSRNQFDDARFPIEYDELPYQETSPLHSLPSHDQRKDKAGRRRSRWLIASVLLSLALTATLVLGRSAVSRYVARTIPAPSGGGKVDASSAGTGASVTASSTATQDPAPVATSITPVATSTRQPSPTATPAPPSGPFQLVVDDEFNGSSINQNAWSLYSGTPGGNTATQWVPSVCSEEGGMLVLPILARPANGRPLSACGMSGNQASTQIYGKYVYRARLNAGYDWYGMFLLWPASGNWPIDGEIDNCEFDAGDVARADCAMTVHWGADNQQTQAVATRDFTQWHTFTVIWLPGSITYQIDGQTVWVDTQHVPTDAMFPAFQTQGNGDASQLGAYDIDYIHIYKYTGG